MTRRWRDRVPQIGDSHDPHGAVRLSAAMRAATRGDLGARILLTFYETIGRARGDVSMNGRRSRTVWRSIRASSIVFGDQITNWSLRTEILFGRIRQASAAASAIRRTWADNRDANRGCQLKRAVPVSPRHAGKGRSMVLWHHLEQNLFSDGRPVHRGRLDNGEREECRVHKDTGTRQIGLAGISIRVRRGGRVATGWLPPASQGFARNGLSQLPILGLSCLPLLPRIFLPSPPRSWRCFLFAISSLTKMGRPLLPCPYVLCVARETGFPPDASRKYCQSRAYNDQNHRGPVPFVPLLLLALR